MFGRDPVPGPDEDMQDLVVQALTTLLRTAGFLGGVLIAVDDKGKCCAVSALQEDLGVDPVDLLRLALARAEAHARGEGVPMNG